MGPWSILVLVALALDQRSGVVGAGQAGWATMWAKTNQDLIGAACEYANAPVDSTTDPVLASYLRSGHHCAIGEEFGVGEHCGKCYRLTSLNDNGRHGTPGSTGSAVVMVSNGGAGGSNHFDCILESFQAITGAATGVFDITYEETACSDVSGVPTIINWADQNAWYCKMMFENIGAWGTLESVRACLDGNTCSDLQRLSGQTWTGCPTGTGSTMDFTLTQKSPSGDVSSIQCTCSVRSWPWPTGQRCECPSNFVTGGSSGTTTTNTIGTTTFADTIGTTSTAGVGTTTTTTSRAPSTSAFLSTTRIATTITTTYTTIASSVWTELGGGCCHGTYMDSGSGPAANLQACKDKCSATGNCVGVAYGFNSGTWCNLYSGQVSGIYTDAYCSTDKHSSLRCYTSSSSTPDTKTCTNTNGAGAEVLCTGNNTKKANFETAACAETTCPTNDAGCCVARTISTGWKNALWTAYESWPRCCMGNPNYDPTANTDECVLYNGCRWAGYFAYKSCSGADGTGNAGQCTIDFVRKNNLVSFFSLSGEHQQYRGKKIRIEAKGKTIEALVVDTCGDSDCRGCCSTNAGKSTDGFLIDMERETVLKHWPEFTDPANQVYSSDMRWQPI